MKHLKVVGKPHPRLDGPETVTGRATYTVDVVLPSMLHAKLFRSSVPHAKIRRLDASRARALPGVLAVLTAGGGGRRPIWFPASVEGGVFRRKEGPLRRRHPAGTSRGGAHPRHDT